MDELLEYLKYYKVDKLGYVEDLDGNRLSEVVTNRGYKQVVLHDRLGNRKCMRVHRLVAICHIPNPDNLPIVNHLNEIKTDNRASNLEWTTPQGNSDHSVKIEHKFISPEGCVVTVRNMSKFARENNLNKSHLTQVRLGNRKQHKGWTSYE